MLNVNDWAGIQPTNIEYLGNISTTHTSRQVSVEIDGGFAIGYPDGALVVVDNKYFVVEGRRFIKVATEV